jgi:hypothetical protein
MVKVLFNICTRLVRIYWDFLLLVCGYDIASREEGSDVWLRVTGNKPNNGQRRIRDTELGDEPKELLLGAWVAAFIKTINDDQDAISGGRQTKGSTMSLLNCTGIDNWRRDGSRTISSLMS